jgi:hypothetical protein
MWNCGRLSRQESLIGESESWVSRGSGGTTNGGLMGLPLDQMDNYIVRIIDTDDYNR